jgi:hypothetical protein
MIIRKGYGEKSRQWRINEFFDLFDLMVVVNQHLFIISQRLILEILIPYGFNLMPGNITIKKTYGRVLL